MSIDSLLICEWVGGAMHKRVVLSPSWSDIEAAIRALNGQNLNDLYLNPLGSEAETYLCIGGGAGKYIGSCSTRGKRFQALVSKDEGTSMVDLVVGGQRGNYPAHYIVTLDAALAAAWAYYETRVLSPEIPWTEV